MMDGIRRLALALTIAATVAGVGAISSAPAAASPTSRTQTHYATGPSPILGATEPTVDGFTVSVLNYSDEYAWAVQTDAGKVTKGSPSGTTWPLKVTGLRPGQSATLMVSAMMPGLDIEPATVTGSALKNTGPTAVKGRVVEHLAFPGATGGLDYEGTLILQRLVARMPTDATATRVAVQVSVARQATPSQLRIARARAGSISKFLASRGLAPVPSVTIVKRKQPGIATVTVEYVH